MGAEGLGLRLEEKGPLGNPESKMWEGQRAQHGAVGHSRTEAPAWVQSSLAP